MYKTKQTQQTIQKVMSFFIMWMQKESRKSSPILSPTYLLITTFQIRWEFIISRD